MVSSSRDRVAAPTIFVETSDLAQSLVTISRATDSALGRWEAKATAPGPLGFVSFRLRLGHGAVLTVPSSLSWSTSHSQLRRGCPRFWIDLHGSRHASHQSDVIGHLIDMNAYRHPLRQPHPGEDRIPRSEPRLIRLRVRDIDASGDAPDMATNKLAVAHQLDTCRVAFKDPAETGLLEIAVDPEGIGIDDGDQLLPDSGVVAELRQQIGYVSTHRRSNHGAAEIELRLGDGGLVQGDDPLRLMQRARRLLVDLRRGPAFFRETSLSALVRAGIIERRGIALCLSLRLLDADPIVGRINFEQHVALMYELVIRDRKLNDSSRDLGRHRDHIGPHRAIARPGRSHVNLPRRPDEHDRSRDRTQRDEYWNDAHTRLDIVAIAGHVRRRMPSVTLRGGL